MSPRECVARHLACSCPARKARLLQATVFSAASLIPSTLPVTSLMSYGTLDGGSDCGLESSKVSTTPASEAERARNLQECVMAFRGYNFYCFQPRLPRLRFAILPGSCLMRIGEPRHGTRSCHLWASLWCVLSHTTLERRHRRWPASSAYLT